MSEVRIDTARGLRPVIVPSAPPASLTRLLDRADAALGAWRQPATVVEMVQTGLAHLRDTLEPDRWLAACAFTQAHPLMASLRQDPIIARSLDKPRGAPGDAVLLDLIARHPDRVGDLRRASALGRALYAATSSSAVAVAVRARRTALAAELEALARRGGADGAAPAVLALGAGHLREAEGLAALADGGFGRFVALESDEHAAAIIAARHGKRVAVQPETLSAVLSGGFAGQSFDLIYVPALIHGLDDRVATRLLTAAVTLLAPGGRLLFGNLAADLWEAGFIEAVMGWHMVLREGAAVASLLAAASRGGPQLTTRQWTDAGGALHYGEITRSA